MKKISFILVLLLALAFLSLLPNALAEFKTPQNTVVIEEEAFMGNSSLSTITLNNGLKRIENNAFSNCDLQEAHLPASVEYIAEDAFDDVCDAVIQVLAWVAGFVGEGLVNLGQARDVRPDGFLESLGAIVLCHGL